MVISKRKIMSGHSKWSQIKRQKGVADAKRANVFTKLANTITLAAKTGKGLDLAIEQAKHANMPKDRIDKSILRGQGKIPGLQIEEATYEAYGPGGAAIMIKVLTDNKNRTISEIRSVLNKFGGTLANSGAVSYLFENKGVITISSEKLPLPKEDAEMLIIDSGADDFSENDGQIFVYTNPKKLEEIKNNLQFKALPIESANLEMNPRTYSDIAEDKKDSLMKMLSSLEDLDDVSDVYTNANL
jgi:YebC/PmpR family DNA-binding regulatory protein